jgi:hypothetical protein
VTQPANVRTSDGDTVGDSIDTGQIDEAEEEITFAGKNVTLLADPDRLTTALKVS